MKSFSKLFSKSKVSKFGARDASADANSSYESYRHFDTGADTAAPPSSLPAQNYSRARERNSNTRKCWALINLVSGLTAISVVGMLAQLLTMLKSSANSHILWPHSMMLKAWPVAGDKAMPLYLLLAAASFTAFVNVSALIIALCMKTFVWSNLRNILALIVRVITTASLLAGVIVLAEHEPNIRSWSCSNKYIENDIQNNVVGFERVCIELSAALAAAIFAALLEAFSVIETIYFMKFKNRKVRREAQFPRQLKIYERLDPAPREQDEIPMLERDRKSKDLERPGPAAEEPEDEWSHSMLEMGRGSMQ